MGPGWLNLARNASAHGIRVHPIVGQAKTVGHVVGLGINHDPENTAGTAIHEIETNSRRDSTTLLIERPTRLNI